MDTLEYITQTANKLRAQALDSFDDMMDSKSEAQKVFDARRWATIKEGFTATQTRQTQLVREVKELINEYDDYYAMNDATFTNQRKQEYQVQEYEGLQAIRMITMVPYYVVFVLILVFRPDEYTSYKQMFVLLIYVTFPLYIDWLVEKGKQLAAKLHRMVVKYAPKNAYDDL